MCKRIPRHVAIGLAAAVFACSIYANLSFLVKAPADYRFFPPFKRHVNANSNTNLGAEYFNIARSLWAGEGFAHPFDKPTGPTAWQGPVLPVILAGLLWVCDGSRMGVTVVVVFLQDLVLIGTGFLVVALAQKTTRFAPGIVAGAFFLGLLCHFQLCFQHTTDCWLVLLGIDLQIAGLCWIWMWPLANKTAAAAWGLFGGLCALTTPVLGFTWGISSFLAACRHRSWSRLALAALVAGLVLTPWTVRNYVVFGRFIPVKSNAAYELYQSQCLQKGGLLEVTTFRFHPHTSTHRERKDYDALGEIAFLDRKREQFWQAVGGDPQNFIERVADRLLGALLWFEPFNRAQEPGWLVWLHRLLHPLPFLALLVVVFPGIAARLHWVQWAVLGVYLLYLLPYIAVSYYERYAVPLLGVKVLLVLWGADRLLSFWSAARTKGVLPAPPGRARPGHRAYNRGAVPPA